MKKIALGIVSTVAMGSTMLIAPGVASARTALDVEIVDISPNPIVVKQGGETKALFDVVASDDAVKVELYVKPVGDQPRTLAAKQVSLDRQGEHWRFSVPFSSGDPAGKWRATAIATDRHGKTDSDKVSFAVEVEKGKADTRITRFSASPDPVKKGRTLWFKGRLQAHDNGWDGYDDAEVGIYFRANHSSGWKWVADAETDRNGRFVTRTRALKSGTFKAVYEGDDDTNGSQSRTDWVRVYKRWHR